MEILPGMIFGVIAVLVAITIYFYQTTRALTEMRQDVKEVQKLGTDVQAVQKAFEKQTELTKELLNELKAGTAAKELPAVDYLSLLMQQWDFFAKLVNNRVQKAKIARYIATKLIDTGDTVVIDSGSTTDLIPKYLVNKKVTMYTNNIFAVVSVSGISGMEIFQLPGFLDYNYAATYSPEALHTISSLTPKKVVVAAKSLSCEDGLRVDKGDQHNRDFKRLLLQHEHAGTFIIAVDWTKFRPCDANERGVLIQTEWESLREEIKSKAIIVTHEPPENVLGDQKVRFNEETDKFKRAGFKVIFVE